MQTDFRNNIKPLPWEMVLESKIKLLSRKTEWGTLRVISIISQVINLISCNKRKKGKLEIDGPVSVFLDPLTIIWGWINLHCWGDVCASYGRMFTSTPGLCLWEAPPCHNNQKRLHTSPNVLGVRQGRKGRGSKIVPRWEILAYLEI